MSIRITMQDTRDDEVYDAFVVLDNLGPRGQYRVEDSTQGVSTLDEAVRDAIAWVHGKAENRP